MVRYGIVKLVTLNDTYSCRNTPYNIDLFILIFSLFILDDGTLMKIKIILN